MKIILASKSPRRRELLRKITDEFEIVTKETDETLPNEIHPSKGVEILAIRKGAAVVPLVGNESLVISSDTLVELDGAPLGKPSSEEDALSMLMRLSGKTHHVHTGVAVHYKGCVYSGVSSSAVTFREISENELIEYIKSGEPLDKAGSYAIQGIGGKFVLGFDGNFDSIVGLDVGLTRDLISSAIFEHGGKIP